MCKRWCQTITLVAREAAWPDAQIVVFIICPFSAMKISPIISKIAKVDSAFCQIGNKLSKICQRLANFCKRGEISPNLVTLKGRNVSIWRCGWPLHKWAIPGLFFFSLGLSNSLQWNVLGVKNYMPWFERRTSVIGSNRYANWQLVSNKVNFYK